ncbi:MAG: thiamine pyrophosphate-binding protein [Myxococcales bacterium]|jgi:acetolactate synthase-1/2/3 large subunit
MVVQADRSGAVSKIQPDVSPASPAPVVEPPRSVSEALAQQLCDLGVTHALGLTGGAVVPLCDALARTPIKILHCRHESGAAFAATELSLASGRPVAVFVTTGPGITNAWTGLLAAWGEGARVILLSGATSAPQRGRYAMQETSRLIGPTLGTGSVPPMPLSTVIEDPRELETVAHRLALGCQRKTGFVAHVGVPVAVQTARCGAPLHIAQPEIAGPDCGDVRRYAQMLAREPFLIWLGFGARHAADSIRAFAEQTGAHVMSSPRAKGIFPEDHPLYLGLTGMGGHESVTRYYERRRPAHILVLGSRLGELTSFWNPALAPREAFIQVDLDPAVLGVAYPTVKTYGIQADVGDAVEALRRAMPMGGGEFESVFSLPPPPRLEPQDEGRIRPQWAMQALQRVVVEGSDAVVMADAGNPIPWTSHYLRFDKPRYRASTFVGSMGHSTTGVIGVALGRKGKAVAVIGDGSMMMNSEVHTAVQYRIPAVWVVLNNAAYGMVDQGMKALGFQQVETRFQEVDFAALARSLGAGGVRVTRESQLEEALEQAMRAEGPFVVDVLIDPEVPAPFLRRVTSLKAQGA